MCKAALCFSNVHCAESFCLLYSQMFVYGIFLKLTTVFFYIFLVSCIRRLRVNDVYARKAYNVRHTFGKNICWMTS